MQPIEPLMREHRLILRMVELMRRELERIRSNVAVDPEFAFVDPAFIDVAVDFLETYADRCHHGKEEDLLFADMAAKDLHPELRKLLEELIAEHEQARAYIRELVRAKEGYLREEEGAVNRVLYCLDKLTAMYPKHIIKEDQHIFIPLMEYFTPEEKAALLEKMGGFDRELIHEKYQKVITALETKRSCRF